ncbi:hypothetical protein GUJ93_ZPchr0009g781 [Zizania palustris]|uniref:Uncharacterized protein n=1 Tax=Zizania palustris TaxID=103762 RepID=A0A8J5RRI3_ZIZPA|nr:hypothetical protein GUJ93_ZPchr0009g781 [Zizania palustris]
MRKCEGQTKYLPLRIVSQSKSMPEACITPLQQLIPKSGGKCVRERKPAVLVLAWGSSSQGGKLGSCNLCCFLNLQEFLVSWHCAFLDPELDKIG